MDLRRSRQWALDGDGLTRSRRGDDRRRARVVAVSRRFRMANRATNHWPACDVVFGQKFADRTAVDSWHLAELPK